MNNNLGKILLNRGIKQSWLADKVGVHYATVSYWISGKRNMPRYRVARLASILNVPKEAIMPSINETEERQS